VARRQWIAVLVFAASALRANAQVSGNYGYGYVYDLGPVGGWMYGLAKLTEANGEYQKQIQDARIKQQEAERVRMANYVQWQETKNQLLALRSQNEKAYLDSMREHRENYHNYQLNWLFNNPPDHYIQSGYGMNLLLEEIAKLGSSPQGSQIPIDPEILKHIRIGNGTSNSGESMSYLNKDGTFQWPAPLMLVDDIEPFLNKMDENGKKLRKNLVEKGQLGKEYSDFKMDLATLQKVWDGHAKTPGLRPVEWIVGNRFLNAMEGSIDTILTKRDAKKYFDGSYELKGGTIGEVTQFMVQKGLQFGRASDIDRAEYRAFFNQLVEYYKSLPKQGS
jgi:hypothetical protein